MLATKIQRSATSEEHEDEQKENGGFGVYNGGGDSCKHCSTIHPKDKNVASLPFSQAAFDDGFLASRSGCSLVVQSDLDQRRPPFHSTADVCDGRRDFRSKALPISST